MKITPNMVRQTVAFEATQDELNQLRLVAVRKIEELTSQGELADAKKWSRILDAMLHASAE